jgi:hypothetical protein
MRTLFAKALFGPALEGLTQAADLLGPIWEETNERGPGEGPLASARFRALAAGIGS